LCAPAPAIEILALAPDIDQAVDRGGPTQALAARPGDTAAVEARHRLRLKLPGDLRVIDVAVEPGRDMDPRVCVLPAGLDNQNPARRIAAQPVDPNATCRTGAHNDNILFQHELHLR